MDEYFAVLKQYAVFSGRAGRREYWRFSLVQIGIAFALAMWLAAALPNEPGDNIRWRDLGAAGLPFYVMMLYDALPTIVPTCAVTVRRLHDADYSGWWLLLGFIPYIGEAALFALLCFKGTAGDNRFGAAPDEYRD